MFLCVCVLFFLFNTTKKTSFAWTHLLKDPPAPVDGFIGRLNNIIICEDLNVSGSENQASHLSPLLFTMTDRSNALRSPRHFNSAYSRDAPFPWILTEPHHLQKAKMRP
ncbi:hypothetical protein AMECASPLE_014760 [Ameca splendens]|uniref:Secreted protein n=1 Tax=Ameca splendens TaxID=208324 RepID=A0ABV0YCQ7_9TELE